MNRAVFLDRDGVLNRLVAYDGILESPRSLIDLDMALTTPDVAGLRALVTAGWLLMVVSNQPNIAKRKMDMADHVAIHQAYTGFLDCMGIRLTDTFYCFHQAGDGCSCRKPRTGLLKQAWTKYDLDLPACWLIGDQDVDVWCGLQAGCRTILLGAGGGESTPTFHCADLATAATCILEGSG